MSPSVRVELPDDIFWYVYEWGAREQRKAHEQIAALITRDVEHDREVHQGTVSSEIEVA